MEHSFDVRIFWAFLHGFKWLRDGIDGGGYQRSWSVFMWGAFGLDRAFYFYMSPYAHTRLTLHEFIWCFLKKRIVGVREESLVREWDFGNFQVKERVKVIKEIYKCFGRAAALEGRRSVEVVFGEGYLYLGSF
ncbi:hypothetical protein JHK82_028039 [Glycine max]|nr:hypothetical protein JHK82_028039 [Glycine max]